MTITTHTIEANGFHFAVEQAGEGDHLALCLHGFPESRFSWRHQIPMLADMGYRVWAPDLRGYGETEPKPKAVAAYCVYRLMEDVAALIDASGAKKVTLIGHDWGAGLAWTFATNRVRPLERLVIMNVPHPAVMRAHLGRSWAQLKKSWYMAFFQIPRLPEWVTTANAAERYKLSERTIRRMISRGEIEARRFGPRLIRVNLESLANAGQPLQYGGGKSGY